MTGPPKPATKSRSGAAQAKKPAAMRLGVECGGASFRAVARASSAPECACVSVSMFYCSRSQAFASSTRGKLRTVTPRLAAAVLMNWVACCIASVR